MNLHNYDFPKYLSTDVKTVKNTAKISIGEIFTDYATGYLNELTLFLAHFNSIPNCIHEIDIDCTPANKWFAENYKPHITDFHYNKRYFPKSKTVEYDDIFYILFEDLLVNFDTNLNRVRFLFRKTDSAQIYSIIDGIKKFKVKKEKSKPEISLLVETKNGFDTLTFPIKKPRLLVEDNYNDDFKEIHQHIVNRLSAKNDKGLDYYMGSPVQVRHLISVT